MCGKYNVLGINYLKIDLLINVCDLSMLLFLFKKLVF